MLRHKYFVKILILNMTIPLNLAILLAFISQRLVQSQSTSSDQDPGSIEPTQQESMAGGTGILDPEKGDCGSMAIGTMIKLPGWPKVVEYAKHRWGSGE